MTVQIDFHHAATYALARIAGFSHEEAHVVGASAQYVDDATHAGVIRFEDGSSYSRHSSAHKALDYRNFQALAQSRVWIPFHFLPGNGGYTADIDPPGGRPIKLVTVPDSPPARDMLRACIEARHRPWGLHRLGITMHVYADTWAHQGFCGIRHEINDVRDVRLGDGSEALSLKEKLAGWFAGEALPLGHGAVLSFPDRPYLRWSYLDWRGERVQRDNPADYERAAQCMFKAMRRWRLGDPDADVPGLGEPDLAALRVLIALEKEAPARHEAWLAAIREGAFSFGRAEERYVEVGPGSWKHEALGTHEDLDRYPFDPGFPACDWKRFHDALQEHRFDMLHVVLPRYGVLAD